MCELRRGARVTNDREFDRSNNQDTIAPGPRRHHHPSQPLSPYPAGHSLG
ncbi:hypothetical protein H6G52_02810 [Limnothrix sp. FACHB-881]|nr:hypothetical protein [Limnothrix sp. FACHB-881]